ncbi:Ig-like domain-containing protein [Methanococcoides seepicolus]|uniref:Ig-like domain-containing protein n=1 Tax=Methanococcoides seepicolus TaxID=2828780 RepID=A0A9E4ZIG9_9EURY|nr:Ig-like domain-containing protein [Methanococcoides seepicolus]MCM1987967.1 Ig-like domain-containing protein [Methanococcoides seepicolus]
MKQKKFKYGIMVCMLLMLMLAFTGAASAGELQAQTQSLEVVELTSANGDLASIKISGNSVVAAGKKIPLTATVIDASGSELEGIPVSWSSEDSNIAVIGATTGELIGVAPGKVKITAADSNSELNGSLEITVGEPLEHDLIVQQVITRTEHEYDEIYGVTMNDGIVYAFKKFNQRLYAFDLYGHELWQLRFGTSKTAGAKTVKPAFGEDGTIYVQFLERDNWGNMSVYAVNPNGTIKWHQEKISKNALMNPYPLIIGDQVIIGVYDGVYSLDAADGSENWYYKINNNSLSLDVADYRLYQSPVSDDSGNIYVIIEGSPVGIEDGKIQVLDINGNEKWNHTTFEGTMKWVTPPVISSSGTVYVTDDTHVIQALNPQDGSIITEDPLNDYVIEEDSEYEIISFLIGSDDTIYVSVNNNFKKHTRYYAINPDGTLKYTHENIHLGKGIMAVDDEGYLYYAKCVGGLAGGMGMFSVDPYGNEAGSIAAFGSSVAEYNNIYIDGNVLLSSRSKFGKFLIAKIDRGTPDVPAVLKISGKDREFGLNLEEVLGVSVYDAEGKALVGQEIVWQSSNSDIIEVLEDGNFKGKGLGTATLTATVNGIALSDSAKINVIRKASQPMTVEIISESGELIESLNVEYSIPYQLYGRILDQYGDVMPDEIISWECGISFGNAVDENGVLDPLDTGTYTISAISATDVTLSTQVPVTIERKPDVFTAIIPAEIAISNPGTITASPVNQYGEAITLESPVWVSSDENIVTISSEGEITAVACGNTTITCTSEGISQSHEVRVVPGFGYEWSKPYRSLNENSARDSNGNIYCFDSFTDKLLSINPDGVENWNLSMDAGDIHAGNSGNIYCLVKVSTGRYNLTSIAPDKTILWNTEVNIYSRIRNIAEAADGTVYVADGDRNIHKLYAIDSEGNEKWNRSFNTQLESFVLDNSGNIICTGNDGDNCKVFIIEDKGNEGNLSSTYTLENYSFSRISNLVVDNNGVLYGYIHDDEVGLSGVAAIENGNLKWISHFDPVRYITSVNPKLVLSSDGVLYFTSQAVYNSVLYAVDTDGNKLWEKHLYGMVNPDEAMRALGDIAVDDDGYVYIPVIKQEPYGYTTAPAQSNLMKINSDGKIVQRVTYPVEKYGSFTSIHINNDSVYVLGYGLEGDHLVKFSFEENQELVPEEIRISGLQNSLLENSSMQLEANVYSQMGTVISGETVTWSSSDESKATVDENGLVTAVSMGDVNIVATLENNPQISACYSLTIIYGSQYYVSPEDVNARTQQTIDYYKQTKCQSDWIAFGLWAAGEDINEEIYFNGDKSYIEGLREKIAASEELGSITEYEKTSLGILAAGCDPHDFGGMNLIEKIAYYPSLSQGINAAIWALVAFNAADAQIPEGANYDQEYMVNYLLEHKVGPGWSLGTNPDIDLTAMAIYSLAPYYNERADVKAAVDEAVEWLKTVQSDNGSFSCFGSAKTNTESTAQVIMALTSVGVDPQSEDFTRNGNPVSALLGNQLPDGSFSHTPSSASNGMSTNQALQALGALKQFNEKGVSTIFGDILTHEETDSIVKPSSKKSSSSSGRRLSIVSSVETPVPPVEEEDQTTEDETVADTTNDGDSARQNADDSGSQGEAEYQEPAPLESEPNTPGFEMIFAVIGILMSVYLAKKH